MNLTRSASRLLGLVGCVAAIGLGGCKNLFVPKYKVLVDAICAPGAVKPTGLSYRLVAKRATLPNAPTQIAVVKACVDAGLGGAGMFEAPENVPPDLFVDVGFGQDTSPRVDPLARETYLQLSARSNPGKSLHRATGEELWDVKVAVLGSPGRIESVMPLLSTVAANYAATDTHFETKLEIPKNSPAIAATRETAIKSLEKPQQAPADLPIGAVPSAPQKPAPAAPPPAR